MKLPFKNTRLSSWKSFSPATKKSFKLFAVFILLACGPMPIDFGEFYSLFYPENATNPENTQKYFYTQLFLNEDMNGLQPNTAYDDSVNIESWKSYLNQKVSFEEIKKALYEKNGTAGLAARIRSSGDTEAADYLLFSGEVDKGQSLKANYWEEAPPADTAALVRLYARARQKTSESKNGFIKERYAFQAVKLAAITGLPEQVVKDYETLVAPLTHKTFISGWAQSRKAGAIMAVGDIPKAVYEFSRVFETCPTRRSQADLSVRRLNNAPFEKALEHCKNEEEKAGVYALQAIQPLQDGLSLMQKMYAANPRHPMLELVMAREINKNEYGFYASRNAQSFNNYGEFNDENYNVDPKKVKAAEEKSSAYFQKLFAFVNTVINDKKTASNQFWLASAAYLAYLNHENDKAEGYIEKLRAEKIINPHLSKQLAFLEMELADRTINPENEAFLIQKIENLAQVDNFRDNLLLVKASEKLSAFYAAKGQKEEKKGGWLASCSSKKTESNPGNTLKAFLAANIGALPPGEYGYQFSEFKSKYLDTCSAGFLKKVIGFVGEGGKTAAEKKLIALSGLQQDDLNLALARRLSTDGSYTEAAAAMAKVSDQMLEKAGFTEYFKASSVQISGKKAPIGSPVEFLNKMAEYQKQTRENPANAEAWYQLGTGLYNLSYYGNAWLLTKRERSSYELEYGNEPKGDYYTTQKAREMFEKALNTKPDPELGAKICYAGALCERNQYLIKYYEGRPDTYEQKDIDAYYKKMVEGELQGFRTFFARLKSTYRDTQYQKMILKECETYSAYLK